MHVLVTKPIVKTLAEHKLLRDAAQARGVLVGVEVCVCLQCKYCFPCVVHVLVVVLVSVKE